MHLTFLHHLAVYTAFSYLLSHIIYCSHTSGFQRVLPKSLSSEFWALYLSLMLGFLTSGLSLVMPILPNLQKLSPLSLALWCSRQAIYVLCVCFSNLTSYHANSDFAWLLSFLGGTVVLQWNVSWSPKDIFPTIYPHSPNTYA